MLKKPHNQIKSGNISKIKYFLPSNNENHSIRPQYEESRLNQIKKSINNKYKASCSSSKHNSKRPSVHKIQNHANYCQNTEINLNDDASFEIVGIRDSNQTINQRNEYHTEKNARHPLNQSNHHTNNYFESNTRVSEQNLTFRNQQQKKVNFLQSSLDKISKNKDFQKFTKCFPKPEEKKEFQRFLQNLKNDENYQNTITMFTIMYFYEQKAGKK